MIKSKKQYPIKVAFIGTQGAGKTTACYELATNLKKLGVHVKILIESAEVCPLPINKDMSLDSQLWMIANQVKQELEAKHRFKGKVIICDRSAIDAEIYAMYGKIPLPNCLSRCLRLWLETYDLLFYMDSSGGHLDDNGIRSTDKEFQREIEKLFEAVIQDNKQIKVLRSKKPVQEVINYLKEKGMF